MPTFPLFTTPMLLFLLVAEQLAGYTLPLYKNMDTCGLYAITQYLVHSVDQELRHISEGAISNPEQQKQVLHSHFQKTREKFLRLLTLVRWTQRHKKSFDSFNDIIVNVDAKGQSMLNTTNGLFNVDAQMRSIRFAQT